jgi:hypothetical protein
LIFRSSSSFTSHRGSSAKKYTTSTLTTFDVLPVSTYRPRRHSRMRTVSPTWNLGCGFMLHLHGDHSRKRADCLALTRLAKVHPLSLRLTCLQNLLASGKSASESQAMLKRCDPHRIFYLIKLYAAELTSTITFLAWLARALWRELHLH